MADIFISYARADQKRIPPIAQALEATGRTVWWDSAIHSGAEFSETIERELDAAGRVLVLWSQTANKSKWVRDEAGVGARNGTLLCASLDGSEPPLGFRQYHFVDLSNYKKGALPAQLIAALDNPADQPVPGANTEAVQKSGLAGMPRWLLVALPLLLLLGLGGWWMADTSNPFSGAAAQETRNEIGLAVMPLDVSGIDVTGERLAAALADRLDGLKNLRLAGARSVNAATASDMSASQIGEELDVQYLVEADVNVDGSNYDASIRLIDSATGDQVWSDTTDGIAESYEKIAAYLASRIGPALQARFDIGEGFLKASADLDPAAHEEYVAGLEAIGRMTSTQDGRDAYTHLKRVIELDPEAPDPHAALAYGMMNIGPFILDLPFDRFLSEFQQAVAKAFALDPDHELATIANVHFKWAMQGEIEEGLVQLQEIVGKSPENFAARKLYGRMLISGGQPRDGFEQLEYAHDINPYDADLNTARVEALFQAGDLGGVRRTVRACEVGCTLGIRTWFFAVVALASEERAATELQWVIDKHRELKPVFDKTERGQRYTSEMMRVGLAVIRGEKISFDPAHLFIFPSYGGVLAARTGNPDSAVEKVAGYLQTNEADAITHVMNPGRMQFTPEQRADPRYHALFTPAYRKIAEHRRAQGVMSGQPISPQNVAAEEARLKAEGYL